MGRKQADCITEVVTLDSDTTCLIERLQEILRSARHCCLKTFLNTAVVVESRSINISKLRSLDSNTNNVAINRLVSIFGWLFDDSKVANRVDTGATEALSIFTLAIRIDQRIDTLQKELRSFLKDPSTLQTLNCTSLVQAISSDTYRVEMDVNKLVKLFGDLIKTTMSVIDDFCEEYAAPPMDDCPVEGKKLYSTLPESLPITRESIQQTVKEYLMLAESSTEDAALNFTLRRLGSRITNSLVSISIVDLTHKNMAKISKNKKPGGWSLGYGRGVSEFANSLTKFACNDELSESQIEIEIDLMEKLLASENQVHKKPKVAKGCVDYEPQQMQLRRSILRRIEDIFLLYGAQSIDTPIFELKETLTGKYGEDQKLIYDLNDQGGEQLGLRYDLTVPFARYCATHAVEKMTRYHIGKVYRRDEPQLSKGRLREFYQCDIDIAGVYDNMLPEAEILSLLTHMLDEMRPIIGAYEVRVSHRSLLDGMMTHCGVPREILRPISSAIDKLDKLPWSAVAEECSAKGLANDIIDKLKEFVEIKGDYGTVNAALSKIAGVEANKDIQSALNDLRILFESMPSGDAVKNAIVIDLSLARGLDYYTGLIYEAILLDESMGIGSIAAGGRYDNLIGMFSGKQIPAIGVSLGIERIFRMTEKNLQIDKNGKITNEKGESSAIRNADVFVCTIGQGLIREKNILVDELRKADIRVMHSLKEKVKLTKQLESILNDNIPFAIMLGSDEVEKGVVKLRQFSNSNDDRSEIEVLRSDIISVLKQKIQERSLEDRMDKLLFQSAK